MADVTHILFSLSLISGEKSLSIPEVFLQHKQLCILSVDQAVTALNTQATEEKTERMVFQW